MVCEVLQEGYGDEKICHERQSNLHRLCLRTLGLVCLFVFESFFVVFLSFICSTAMMLCRITDQQCEVCWPRGGNSALCRFH